MFTASELCNAPTYTTTKNLLTWFLFRHFIKIFSFFYCSLLKFTHWCKKWLTFYIVSWYTHQTIEYRKSFFRYFGSILKAFRVIGAVLEQIESLHKTELEASQKGRAFRSVCVAFFASIACLHFENRTNRLYGIPGQDLPQNVQGKRARQRRQKGAGSSCRENGKSARLLQLCRCGLFAHT